MMFSRLKTKMLKILLCLDKSEMKDLQIKKNNRDTFMENDIQIPIEFSFCMTTILRQHMTNSFRLTKDIESSRVDNRRKPVTQQI